MNILYLCTFYHTAFIFRDAMNHLEKRGHKVTAFNAVARGTIIDKKYMNIMDEKVVHQECFYSIDRYSYFGKQKKILSSIKKNFNINDFEVIHSHTMFNGGWVAKELKKEYGIPYVVTVRNTDVNDFMHIPFFNCIGNEILRNASGVQFLSGAYKDYYCGKYAKNYIKEFEQKSRIIPNGLEAFWLENVNKRKTEIHSCIEILCVGKIDKNKNIKKIVECMTILECWGYKVHLTVIGKIINKSVYKDLEVNRLTTIIPFMDKENLIKYYRKADVFVMPSYKESFGRVYVESISQGTPIVYTKDQGFDGFFDDGFVGYKVNPYSATEIAWAIINILRNYEKLSQQCVKCCGQFSWDIIAESLEHFYADSIKYKRIKK